MKHLLIVTMVLSSYWAMGQKYFSKTGKISFYSDAPLEKIEAHNTSASTVIDVATGSMEWSVLIKGFKFEKALMQEHFNENYMESHEFPKAKFTGKIENLSSVNFSKDGEYKIQASGTLEIHGVSKSITAPGTITIKNGAIAAESKISVLLADYDIEIPKMVADNISKSVDIVIKTDYQLLNTVP